MWPISPYARMPLGHECVTLCLALCANRAPRCESSDYVRVSKRMVTLVCASRAPWADVGQAGGCEKFVIALLM